MGILQAGVLDGLPCPPPGIFPPRDRTQLSHIAERCMCPSVHSSMFTTARTWKQPSVHQQRNGHTHRHTHNGVLLSHKKEWNNIICSNRGGSRDYHTKWSKSERKINITCMWNLKKWYKWTYLQNRNRLSDTENRLMVTKGEEEKGKFGSWD